MQFWKTQLDSGNHWGIYTHDLTTGAPIEDKSLGCKWRKCGTAGASLSFHLLSLPNKLPAIEMLALQPQTALQTPSVTKFSFKQCGWWPTDARFPLWALRGSLLKVLTRLDRTRLLLISAVVRACCTRCLLFTPGRSINTHECGLHVSGLTRFVHVPESDSGQCCLLACEYCSYLSAHFGETHCCSFGDRLLC